MSIVLSLHDKSSLVKAVSSLQFNAVDDPNPILATGSISHGVSLRIGLDDRNAVLEMPVVIDISQERRDDDIGGSDDIQMVYT